jgi:hypothetical protein
MIETCCFEILLLLINYKELLCVTELLLTIHWEGSVNFYVINLMMKCRSNCIIYVYTHTHHDKITVIPRFTNLIRPPKLLVRRKLVKRKLISHHFPTGTTIGWREEVARIRKIGS